MADEPPPDEITVKVPIPREVWVIVAAGFVIAVGYGLISPILSQYAKSFNVDTAAAALVISTFAFFRLTGAPFAGTLIEKVGERRTYLTGLAIVVVSTFATAFAGSYSQLLVFRGLGGIGSVMFSVSALGLLVRLSPSSARGRVTGLYATGFTTGTILGPTIGGALGTFGMRVPFIVYATAVLVALLLVAVMLPNVGTTDRSSSDAAPPMTLREGLSLGIFRSALLSSFAAGWGNFGFRVAILPLFAAAVLNDPARAQWAAGLALTAFALGSTMAVPLSGRVSDRVGRRPLLIIGLVSSGGCAMLLGQTSTLVQMVAVSVVAGFCAGAFMPPLQAAVADVVGNDRSGGRALATFQMASDFGAIVGPLLAGLMVDIAGFSSAFTITGVLLASAGLMWVFVSEPLRHSRAGDVPIKRAQPGD